MARYISYARQARIGQALADAEQATGGAFQWGYTNPRRRDGQVNYHLAPAGDRPNSGQWPVYLTPEDGLGGRWAEVEACLVRAIAVVSATVSKLDACNAL